MRDEDSRLDLVEECGDAPRRSSTYTEKRRLRKMVLNPSRLSGVESHDCPAFDQSCQITSGSSRAFTGT